jgi:hypothetical protein
MGLSRGAGARVRLAALLWAVSSPAFSSTLWGTESGADDMCAAIDSGTQLDATRWRAWPGAGQIEARNVPPRTATIVGAWLALTWPWRENADLGLGMQSQVPVLQALLPAGVPPTDAASVATAVINGMSNSWQVGITGLLLFDIDRNGNMRPILRVGIQMTGASQPFALTVTAWHVRCTGAPGTGSSSCNWVELVGNNTAAVTSNSGAISQATPSNPWRFTLRRDPANSTWTPSVAVPGLPVWTGPPWSDAPASMEKLMGSYWAEYLNSERHGIYSSSALQLGVFSDGRLSTTFTLTVSVDRLFVQLVPLEAPSASPSASASAAPSATGSDSPSPSPSQTPSTSTSASLSPSPTSALSTSPSPSATPSASQSALSTAAAAASPSPGLDSSGPGAPARTSEQKDTPDFNRAVGGVLGFLAVAAFVAWFVLGKKKAHRLAGAEGTGGGDGGAALEPVVVDFASRAQRGGDDAALRQAARQKRAVRSGRSSHCAH